MGEIRSALDIALEKTADIHGDKSGADNREIKNQGKKAAGDFFAAQDPTALAGAAGALAGGQKQLFTEGALSVLLAALRLPQSEADLPKLELAGSGICALLPGSGMEELFAQVKQLFSQYLAEYERLSKMLEQQFMPRLRAKQQELAKRYGQNVPLDPLQDPEYASALSKNRRMIEQKYESVIDEIRGRVREAAGIAE